MFIPTPGAPLPIEDIPSAHPLSIASRFGWLLLTLFAVSIAVAIVFAVAPDIRDLVCPYANCSDYPRTWPFHR